MGIDRIVGRLLGALALACGGLVALVLAFLLSEAWPALAGDGWLKFLTDAHWYPLDDQVGLAPMLWATVALTAGSTAIAVPIGLGSAVFVCYYAPPPLARGYRLVLALLTGIPSVVYGLWGLTVLVPLIARWQPPGTSLLAGILVLALMILPTVALTAAAALAAVPEPLLAGAAALGLGRRSRILRVALPAARGGIAAGALLASARALGETMAVLMVSGNVARTPHGPFDSVRALTANIAMEMAYATGTHRAGLFVAGLLLACGALLLAWTASRTAPRDRHG